LERAVAEARKTMTNHDGVLVAEGYNLLNAWLSIIPGNSVFNVRRLALSETNCADLSFMIDHVMRFNREAASERMAELARVAGAPGGDRGTVADRAQAFVDWLAALKAEIGIPARLSDHRGARAITRDDLPALVRVAEKDICHQTNPRPCTTRDFEAMFEAAL
jgi:hypothetical protein